MAGKSSKLQSDRAGPRPSNFHGLHEETPKATRTGSLSTPFPGAVTRPSSIRELRGTIGTHPLRVAFVGNALPRRCGIATFTTDLELAVSALPDVAEAAIIAMRDPGSDYACPPPVRFSIDQDMPEQYVAAADFINSTGFDVVCLQHEFGIYGGLAGDLVLGLIAALKVPLVTTFHTVLDQPTPDQRRVMKAILSRSARVVVMARKGREILIETYGAAAEKIVVIPHGIPDAAFEPPEPAKRRLGFEDHQVILTFGLLGPGKGIETMIEAMPAIIASAPHAVYVVMGATHPQLLREAGEAYRDSLVSQVRARGLERNVVFLNRFVDRPELLEHIAMCDVYVTPYLGVAQMTSGTLAYSHGMGRPVVSTPYWHAAELLGDGSGILVPFGDPDRLGRVIAGLLADDGVRLAMAEKAYKVSRPTTWARTAERYAETFQFAVRKYAPSIIGGCDVLDARPTVPLQVSKALTEPDTHDRACARPFVQARAKPWLLQS